jgi:hypothetical protein
MEQAVEKGNNSFYSLSRAIIVSIAVAERL